MSPVAPSQAHARLRVFLAAAHHLSFTRAGEELHITTGAVSQQQIAQMIAAEESAKARLEAARAVFASGSTAG